MTNNYEAAFNWYARGYNVVPRSPGGKHPAVRWIDLQTRSVTRSELVKWQSMFANGVGFITGAISDAIVIDTDGLLGETVLAKFEFEHVPLPETLVIRSGSGRGLHRHFKHPGYKVKTTANPRIKVDVKGDGGFCVLPPTLHQNGGRYEIVHHAKSAELPRGLLEFIEAEATQARGEEIESPRIIAASTCEYGITSLGNNLTYRVPVNLVNVALVQTMLDALPVEYAKEFDLWLRTGFALHDFDDGEIGLALWKRFSNRCPEKANGTDFEMRWAGLSRPYQGKKISIGWLRGEAKTHGWRASCNWDRSTKIVS